MTRVVVASGKGGTGKTLVATSLALMAADLGSAALLDADVEAPNAALFLEPEVTSEVEVQQLTPVVDASRCIHCGRCAEVCAFHAIAALPQQTLVFPELCHGCGSCALVCPAEAIQESPHHLGVIEMGRAGEIAFAQGRLEIGEAMATPLIRALGKQARQAGWLQRDWVIVDAPPGIACPVIEALRGADVTLLVTEPTPFGLHDLRLAVEVARDVLRLPVAVALNKDGDGAEEVEDYCHAENLPLLLRIPYRREIAVAYSVGEPLLRARPEFAAPFEQLLLRLRRLARETSP